MTPSVSVVGGSAHCCRRIVDRVSSRCIAERSPLASCLIKRVMSDRKDLNPRCSRFSFDVAEHIWERRYSFFHVFNDILSVPTSLAFISKSEFWSTECCLKMHCTIEENRGAGDVVFLTNPRKNNSVNVVVHVGKTGHGELCLYRDRLQRPACITRR